MWNNAKCSSGFNAFSDVVVRRMDCTADLLEDELVEIVELVEAVVVVVVVGGGGDGEIAVDIAAVAAVVVEAERLLAFAN